MRLAEWRRNEGLTQQELADRLGVSQPAVSALERWPDNSVPQTKELMVRIYTVTGRAVMPNDFYDLPSLGAGEPRLPLPIPAEPELQLDEAA